MLVKCISAVPFWFDKYASSKCWMVCEFVAVPDNPRRMEWAAIRIGPSVYGRQGDAQVAALCMAALCELSYRDDVLEGVEVPPELWRPAPAITAAASPVSEPSEPLDRAEHVEEA